MNTKTKTLSDSELRELKKQAVDVLAQARQKLLMKFPFAGSVSMKLDLVPVRDKRVRTAQTDGRCVYFDINFLSELNPEEQLFVLGHEVWHCVMMHLVRLQNRDMMLFNMATDMEVNNLLKEDGLIPPPHLLFPEKGQEGKSAEELYEILLRQQKKEMKNFANGKGSGSGSGSGSGNSNGTSSSGSSGGSGNGKLTGQFDKHTYDNTDESEEENPNDITDKWGDVGYDKDYNPRVSSSFSDEMRETIVSAAQQVERTKGSVPSHIQRIVNGVLKPEIKWQDVLAQFVTASFKSGQHRWIPPSRRHVWKGMYIPSKKDDQISVTVAIDTSGSTSNDLPKFFSELIGLLNTFGNYKLKVIQCDAEVDSVEDYDSNDNPFDFKIEDYKFGGGGGSSTIPVFDHIADNGMESDCLIYMTDGYIDAPEFPPNYPVLWILTHDGDMNFCKWGRKIRFKHNATN